MLLLLVLYSAAATAGLILLTLRSGLRQSALGEAEKLVAGVTETSEKAKLLVEIAKARQGELPFYERIVSVVGVVAFFSMTAATSIQTCRAINQTEQIERLRAELSTAQQERAALESLITDIAAATVQQYRQTGRIESAQQAVLMRRLTQLASVPHPSAAETLETYQIALVVRDYALAGDMLEQYVALMGESTAADLITIAEYYYFNSAIERAKALLARVKGRASTMPPDWRIRALSLEAVVAGDVERAALQLAALLRIPTSQARLRLEAEILRLRETRKRFAAREHSSS